ncbi:MAG: cadherin domain-containing protein, partial [Pseudomonadota bacterium]
MGIDLTNQGQSDDPGRDQSDPVEGTPGDDCYDGRVSQDEINGNGGNDTLNGGSGNDTLRGGSGNDLLNGDANRDSLDGGTGNDTLNGGSGNDTLEGGTDNDLLSGGDDSDILFGNSGADTLQGGNAEDDLTGGGGSDLLEGGQGNDIYRFSPGDGTDTVVDTSGTSTLAFAEGTELAFRRPGNGDLRIEYGTAATDVVIVSGFYSQNLDAQTVVLIGSNPVTVNVTPSDITLNNTAVAEVADPGALVGLLGNDDPDGEPITYVIESDPSGLFRIEGDELRTNGPLDFEIQSSYQIDISATDPVGGSVTETFTIDVININEPPSGLSFTSVPVPETAPVFFEVGTITAFDPEGDQLSYQIDGDFGDLFAISGDKVIVTGALDASTPLYQVEITATDRSFNTTSAQFVISITDVDQPPTGLALSAAEVDDGDAAGTVVGTLSATDPEGEAVSFRITDSANGLFSLDGDDLVLAQSVEFDDGAERSVTVLATDPTGNTSTEVFTITVADSDTMTGGSGNDDLPPA